MTKPRPLTLAEALSHPSIERVIALMRATDERGRVLVHEAAARCLAVHDPAALEGMTHPASDSAAGVVLTFPEARARTARRRP